MRTELTLDDDVVVLLAKEMERTRASFEDVLQKALREGLTQMAAEHEVTSPPENPLT